ncbi:MAG: GntR family transcriptional regulator [Phycisphaerae bacterium]
MAKKGLQSEKAYQTLRRQLLGRAIESGTRVAEVIFSKALQVNRGDIRQALARLHAEGLVCRGERGGYFAPKFSLIDNDQITEVRLILESAAIRLAAKRAKPADFRDLDKICNHMDLMARHGYRAGLNETDFRFHERLVQAAHNDRLSRVYQHANLPLSYGPVDSTGELNTLQLTAEVEQHRQILAAVKTKQVQKAIERLEAGLKKTHRSLKHYKT